MNHQVQKLVHVLTRPVEIDGNLSLPSNASGTVLFAHGSGSSWHSPRNQFVAAFFIYQGDGHAKT